jgi:hypothetical protein
MIRRAACALVVAAIWLILLGWAAGLSWNTPVLAQKNVHLNASDFHVVFGAGVEDETALRIGAIGDDGNALQSIALDHLHAEDFSTLRYRFDSFPKTLELSLIFRRADAPDDVQTITVPWPGDGERSVELSTIPGWHGEIIELGFAEYATPQLVPPSIAFRPFRFDQAELWSPSWRGGIGALYTSWFGYAPWGLLSVSALGPSMEVAQGPGLTPILALAAMLAIVAAALILRWSRRTLARAAIIAAVLCWALLDLLWLHDFHAKNQLTRSVYGEKSWGERARLLPDQDTASAAEQVKNWFATQPPAPRILVACDSNYTFLRLIYLLLPLDAAPLQEAAGVRRPPRDTVFVLYANARWQYDEARAVLISGSIAYPVQPVFDSGDVHIYRLRSAKP